MPTVGSRARPSRLESAFATQANVIGALMMRELHTRYGRENVGYLWMILEPMTFAGAVAALHAKDIFRFSEDIQPVPFTIVGYGIFIMFRQIFNRSDDSIQANLPLLYHRQVNIFNMQFARALIEGAGTFATVGIMLGFSALIGLGKLPVRPLALMAGIGFMFWISFALSLLVCAGTHERRLVSYFVHPISYMMIPISGAFYRLQWLPDPYRTWMSWFPLTQIFELIRYGQFEVAEDTYVMPIYLVLVCTILTFLGLCAIRAVRPHIHLS